MALINCPNCNKQISDKSKNCVGCGYQLVSDLPSEHNQEIICPECGATASGMESCCFACGYPFNFVKEKDKKKKRNSLILIFVIITILISIIAVAVNFVKTAEYNEEIREASNAIVEAYGEVKMVDGQVTRVWHDAIWGEDNPSTSKYTKNAKDFNEALANLYASDEYTNKVSSIMTAQTEIDVDLAELKNPPKKYEEAYIKFKELYSTFSAYADFVISSEGSYNSYTEESAKKEEKFLECYREIKVILLSN